MTRLILARVTFMDPLGRKDDHIKEFKHTNYIDLIGDIQHFLNHDVIKGSQFEIKYITFEIQKGVRLFG